MLIEHGKVIYTDGKGHNFEIYSISGSGYMISSNIKTFNLPTRDFRNHKEKPRNHIDTQIA